MKQSSFEAIADEIIVSVRSAEGLSNSQLKRLLSILHEELKCWTALDAIPKSKVYALIILRDNIIGARNYYKKDDETMNNLCKAESEIDLFMEAALVGA